MPSAHADLGGRLRVFAITVLSSVFLILISLLYRRLHVSNVTTVALTYLLVVLVVAATLRLASAVVTSVVAMMCLNYFFLPPIQSFAIAGAQNWFAWFAFLAVSLVASHLSAVARTRAEEALIGRDQMARLFGLSRDVLRVTDTRAAVTELAGAIARQFGLEYVAICLPVSGGWNIFGGGPASVALDERELSRVMAAAESELSDPSGRMNPGHGTILAGRQSAHVVPLLAGRKLVGLLVAISQRVESATLDAIGGVTAIAIERVQLLEDRKAVELARQSEELKSALLASLGHDLRTPLTAIRVAAGNLQAAWLTAEERREQSDLVLTEVERLTRLFQNILEMARIEAGAVGADFSWVHPSEIVEAARDQVVRTLSHHAVEEAVAEGHLVRVDPRLTASALAHVLENAAQYSPPGSTISVAAEVTQEGLTLAVRDQGPGVAPHDLPRVFDRFYRSQQTARRVSGTGMGLAIARGVLSAERGEISVENCADGGACFNIRVPADIRVVAPVEQTE